MFRIRVFLIAAALASAPAFAEPPSTPTIAKTELGAVRGLSSRGVISFKGIPYAAPPVGDLRWRVPQPGKSWKGIRDATDFGPSCPQTDNVEQSEDCLTLNVWKPANASAPVPVMVWIYGGALMHGSTPLYPADALATQGVVVVSMNYRMGRLGFFAHPALAAESPSDVRGNYGYLDQLAALEWVKRNIDGFGGNPKEVTIFGESAGGGSVTAHLISPLSRGLFHRAILQSPGVPTAREKVLPLSDLKAAEKAAVDWAESMGITGDGTKALKRLRSLPLEQILAGASAKEEIIALSAGKHVTGFAGSMVDGKFITETTEVALAAGHQAKVPVIVGANDRDLWVGIANSKDELFAAFGPRADDARKLYDRRGDQTLEELKQQVFADKTLVEPARHLADEIARADQPVWIYRFAYVSQAQRGKNMGTLHGFEIPFTMNIPSGLVGEAVTPTDKAMADLASAYWVKFGQTGDPNGEARPLWPRYDPAVDRIIHFTNSGIIVGTDPLKARLDLWERVWKRTN